MYYLCWKAPGTIGDVAEIIQYEEDEIEEMKQEITNLRGKYGSKVTILAIEGKELDL